MLQQSNPFFRFLALVTLLTFFPSSVAVWNFIPPIQQVAVAEEVADGDGNANPAPDAITPTTELAQLSEAELRATASQAVTLASTKRDKLPKFEDLPKRSDVGVKHLQLAQAEDENDPTEGGDAATSTAQLADAEAALTEGRSVDAFEQSITIAGDYPDYVDYPQVETADALAALNLSTNIVANASEAELNEIEAALPAIIQSAETPEAKRRAIEFLYHRANQFKMRGTNSTWENYARTYLGYVRQLSTEFPYSLSSHFSLNAYMDLAEELGDESLLVDLEAAINQLPASVVRMKVWNKFGELAENTGDRVSATHYYHRVTTEYELGAYNALLADPAISGGRVKAAQLATVARAYYYLGDKETARQIYESAAEYPVDMTRVSGKHHGPVVVQLMLAEMTARENPYDPYDGIVAYYNFVQSFPESPHVPQALTRLGALYMTASDYLEASKYFGRVVQEYPDSEFAEIAQHELNFLANNMIGTFEVADGWPVNPDEDESVKVAQLCGPTALANLLARKDIDASVDDLAAAAGTDETGSTMLVY
jgi:tetratricopeptide (TPR) repeat protein